MKIDIEKLNEQELIDLNHRIIARLKYLNQIKTHETMLEFRIGERVSFQPDDHPLITGMLTKYNKKTVTIITDQGEHWNVAPVFLNKVNTNKEAENAANNILPFEKKQNKG